MNRLFQVPSRVSLTNRPYLQRGVLRFKSSQSSDAIKRPVQKLVLPEPDDPRPRWGVTANKISSFVIIPCALVYAVFFMDFGDHEHIFSPPRRWLKRQQEAFFSLTPAERELVEQGSAKTGEEASAAKPSA